MNFAQEPHPVLPMPTRADNWKTHPVPTALPRKLSATMNSAQDYTWFVNHSAMYAVGLPCQAIVHDKCQMQTIDIQKITIDADISFQENFRTICKTEKMNF